MALAGSPISLRSKAQQGGTLRSARATARAGRTSVDVIRKETHCPVRRVARDDAKQTAGDGERVSRTRGAHVESNEYENGASERGGPKFNLEHESKNSGTRARCEERRALRPPPRSGKSREECRRLWMAGAEARQGERSTRASRERGGAQREKGKTLADADTLQQQRDRLASRGQQHAAARAAVLQERDLNRRRELVSHRMAH